MAKNKKRTKSATTKKTTAKKSAVRRAPAKKGTAGKSKAMKSAVKKTQRRKPAASKSAATPPPPPHGAWVWHELMTTDVKAARKFYKDLFGWDFGDMPMGDFNYTIIRQKGTDAGGMMPMEGPQWQGIPPHWMVYIAVEDVDEAARKCDRAGGKVCVPPTDIPVGRFAVLTDPLGATFSIYKSKTMK